MDSSIASEVTLQSLTNSASTCSTGHYALVTVSASNLDLIHYNSTPRTSTASTITTARASSSTKIIAAMSLFIGILCLICIVGLSCWIFVFEDRASANSSKLSGDRERAEVCVPCEQLRPDPLDNGTGSSVGSELTVRHDENNTKICCATTAAQYAALFKLILQRQQVVQELADYLKGNNTAETQPVADPKTPVSAHLVFKPPSQRSSGDEDRSVQHWKSPAESHMSHILSGLSFNQRTRLLVQTPGLYYVYCQFLYNPDPNFSAGQASDAAAGENVTSAYVRRHSILHPSYSSFLLKSRHTRSDASKDRHSSYVGGVVRLFKGDRLYVQVSEPQLISYDEVASFFGLFRVGP